MIDLEKVINGLELCTFEGSIEYCIKEGCPYLGGNGVGYCIDNLMRDALALLKAQEPHVMTLGEIANALKMPLWKETKRVHKDLYTGWVLAYEIQNGLGITGTRLGMSEPSGRVVWYSLDDYGKTWRCWTSVPTEEVRRATPWNAQN